MWHVRKRISFRIGGCRKLRIRCVSVRMLYISEILSVGTQISTQIVVWDGISFALMGGTFKKCSILKGQRKNIKKYNSDISYKHNLSPLSQIKNFCCDTVPLSCFAKSGFSLLNFSCAFFLLSSFSVELLCVKEVEPLLYSIVNLQYKYKRFSSTNCFSFDYILYCISTYRIQMSHGKK